MKHSYRAPVVLSCLLTALAACSAAQGTPEDSEAEAGDGAEGEVPAFGPYTPVVPGGGAANDGSAAPAPAGTGGSTQSPPPASSAPLAGAPGMSADTSSGAGPLDPAPNDTDPAGANAGEPVGSPAPVDGASAGCGLSQGTPSNVAVPNTIVTFPSAYDGSTPFPLVFAFHGAGRTNEDMRLVDSRTVGSELEANYVMAFMKSAGNGWDIGADSPRFEAAFGQLLAELCIDTRAVFAFGHSSGAQFIAQMLGDPRTRETRFAGVVPVASSLFQNPAWAPLPTLVIHGLRDTARGGDPGGALDVTQYTQSNQCPGGTQPLGVPSCASLAGGVAVNPGCVQYTGCAAPTLFCNHDDPNYLDNGNPTNHGWPCFANTQIFQFFESLR